MNNYKRLRELDFLRGIAILLVLLRHQALFAFTTKMGWIGVDLFFVLSGFLVSGLLFKEYAKFGSIRPKLFLIRRGFKIYPIYYLFYGFYLIPILVKGKFNPTGFFSDMFFVQNYVWGWGYAFAQSWSLAVEEHFYFGLALALFLAVRRGTTDFTPRPFLGKITRFEATIAAICCLCFALRIATNIVFPNDTARNITMTHLRIDSLLAGVLISYWFHFRRERLQRLMDSNRKRLLLLAFLLVSFTPFIEPKGSFFVNTIGFTLLYSAFAIILAWMITDDKVNSRLDAVFSRRIVDGIGKVGVASYSIYIIHLLVNYLFGLALSFGHIAVGQTVVFLSTSAVSIAAGILMTRHVEKFFLSRRDKYFPSRTD